MTKAKRLAKKITKREEERRIHLSENEITYLSEKETNNSIEEKIFIQFEGKEISQLEIMRKVADNYSAEENPIEEMVLYIKPEDHAAYYVINGTENGKINL